MHVCETALTFYHTHAHAHTHTTKRHQEPLLRAFLVSNLVHEADKSWRWRLNLDALKRFIGPIRSWDIRTPTSTV